MPGEINRTTSEAVYPGGKDKEYVDCPYCGETAFTRMTSQNVSMYKLDAQGNPVR